MAKVTARILVYTTFERSDKGDLLTDAVKHWVSVAAAIVDGERILAIRRRDNNKWEPPGGTLEADETIHGGLCREVREEIGVEIAPGPLTGVYKNMDQGIVALVFRCEHTGQTPNLSAEVSEIRWMTRNEVREELDPAYACRLLDGLDRSSAAIREHDGIRLLGEGVAEQDRPPSTEDVQRRR